MNATNGVLIAMATLVLAAIAMLAGPLVWIHRIVRAATIRDLDAEIFFDRLESHAQALRGKGVWLIAFIYSVVGVIVGIGVAIRGEQQLAAALSALPWFLLGLAALVQAPWVFAVYSVRRRLHVPWDVAESVFRADMINSTLTVAVLISTLTTVMPMAFRATQEWYVAPSVTAARQTIAAFDSIVASTLPELDSVDAAAVALA